ncbi:MAG: XRE family transcriptional regulator, partial [Candidatus Limnocylindria bacterium]
SQVLDKVFQMLRADGIKARDIATELQIPTEELNKLVFGLVLTRLEGSVQPRGTGSTKSKTGLRLVQ